MKIGILGLGRMGSWFVELLRPYHSVIVFDTDESKKKPGFEDVWAEKREALYEFSPNLLLNAAPLDKTIDAFNEVLPNLSPSCALCDIASVKSGLSEYYQKAGRNFLSLHPMFGPTFTDMKSLQNENVIFISESDANLKLFFENLFRDIGVNTFEFPFEAHDSMMAYSLTTPFVASLTFAACVKETAVPGTTFAKHKKIAEGLLSEDDHLLAEILFNRYSLTQLDIITSRLEFLKHIIRAKDDEEATRFFQQLRKNLNT